MSGKTLSERLANLVSPGPALAGADDDDDDLVTGAKVVDEDIIDDLEIPGERSQLRVRSAVGLDGDERYRGKKGSRRKLDQDEKEHQDAELGHMFDFGDEDDDEDEEDDSGSDMGEDKDSDMEEDDDEGDIEEKDDGFTFDSNGTDFASFGGMSDEENSDSDEEESDDNKDDNDDKDDEEIVEDDAIVTVPVSESDPYMKGCSVVDQLATWDRLLEQRILLQKMMAKVNRFPDSLETFLDHDDKEHKQRVKKAEKSLTTLLLKMIKLKSSLERKSAEEESNYPGPSSKLSELGIWLGETHRVSEPSRRDSLAHWGDRTQKLGSSWDSMHTPVVQQVEQIMSNKGRLINRTRVKRSEYRVIGAGDTKSETETSNPNIFDDSDFYHQLLRELIERKTSGANEAGNTGRQWLQIQKLRSKLKKKVDTKASKGRKIRYDVHSKLVNFMAPVISREGQMEETAKNELFSSLFGARKTLAVS